LDGDSWKICLTTRGSERPREFAAPEGTGIALEILRRTGTGEAAEVRAALSGAAVAEDGADELAGEWKATTLVRDGDALPTSMLSFGKRTATATEVTVKFGPQVILKAHYSVDRSKSPMTMDYELADGKRLAGIWKLEGGQLTTCFGAAGPPGPRNSRAPRDRGSPWPFGRRQESRCVPLPILRASNNQRLTRAHLGLHWFQTGREDEMRLSCLVLLALISIGRSEGQEHFTPTHRISGIGISRDDISEDLLAIRSERMIDSQTFSIMREADSLAGAKRVVESPKLQAIFRSAASSSGLPASLIEAICYLESWGDPKAQSATGPKGIMQISAATAASMGLKVTYATRYKTTKEKVAVKAKGKGKTTYRTVTRKIPYKVLVRDDRMLPERAIPAAANYLAGMERKFGGAIGPSSPTTAGKVA
jgi:uncharacterized protein (TIGR03067 family)